MSTPEEPAAGTTWAGLPPNVRGVLWLVASALASSAMLIATKFLGDRINTFQIVFVRAAASCVLATPLLARLDWRRALRPRHPLLLVSRSVLAMAAMAFLFFSVSAIPLADAQALNFASVIFVIPLSALILKEMVGINRWAAVGVGFLGVLIVLRPTGAVELGALAGVLGAASYAAMLVNVRWLSRGMDANTLYLWGVTLLALFSLPPALVFWTMPSGHDWLVLGGIGVLGATSQYTAVRAYAVGEASAIAPTDYLKLVFALAGGALLFGERPDGWTLMGAGLIVAATAYAAYREARRRR